MPPICKKKIVLCFAFLAICEKPMESNLFMHIYRPRLRNAVSHVSALLNQRHDMQINLWLNHQNCGGYQWEQAGASNCPLLNLWRILLDLELTPPHPQPTNISNSPAIKEICAGIFQRGITGHRIRDYKESPKLNPLSKIIGTEAPTPWGSCTNSSCTYVKSILKW